MTQKKEDTLVDEQRLLRKQISSVKTDIQQKKKRIKDITSKLRSCDAYKELNEVQQKIKDIDKDRTTLQDSLRQSKSVREQLRLTAAEGEVLRDKLTVLKSKEKALRQDMDNTEQDVVALKHHLPFHSVSALDNELSQVKQQLQKAEHSNVKDALLKRVDELKKMRIDVQSLEKAVKELDMQRNRLENIVQDKQSVRSEKSSIEEQAQSVSRAGPDRRSQQAGEEMRRLNDQRRKLTSKRKELEQIVQDKFPEEEKQRKELEGEVDKLQKRQRKLSDKLRRVTAHLTEEQVVFAEDEYPVVVGKKGRRLRKLRDKYGVDVDVDRMMGVVSIRGSRPAVEKAADALRQDVFNERIVEDTMTLPDNMVGQLLAQRGRVVNEVRDKSQARVHVDPDQALVTMEGPAARVRSARSLLQEWLDDNRMLEERVEADPALVRLLLQDKGKRIKDIKDKTGAQRISVEEGRGWVVMEGPRDTARRARDAVEELRRGVSHRELRFGEELQGLILGKKGSNVRRIEEETGAVLAMEKAQKKKKKKKKKQTTNGDGTLHICGSEEAVEAAYAELDELLRANRKNTTQVTFEPRFVQTLLAERGAALHRIQRECQVRIDVSRLRGIATISGKASGTRDAAAKVREVVDAARRTEAQMRTERIPMKGRSIGAVIGRRGRQIQRIRRKSQATVTVDEDGEVRIRGMPDQVTVARSMVERILQGDDGNEDDKGDLDNDSDDDEYNDGNKSKENINDTIEDKQ